MIGSVSHATHFVYYLQTKMRHDMLPLAIYEKLSTNAHPTVAVSYILSLNVVL